MNPHYHSVSERARHRCEYCLAPEVIFNGRFEVEHVIPRSRQGLDEESNLALACRFCNVHKGDEIDGLDDASGRMVRLFHPRTDQWEDHFFADSKAGIIHGKTEIGRVTIARLGTNSPTQVEARRLWAYLGLFP